MILIPFKYNNLVYYLTILEETFSKCEINFINNRLNDIYKICFNNLSSYESLISFVQNKGINILIFDNFLELVFVSSFIKNSETRNIELYNVCKKLNDKNIEISVVLEFIIKEFIIKIPLFDGYNQIVLSVINDSKYLVPTILCYFNIGFRYCRKNIKMSVVLPKYISMILNTRSITKLSPLKKIKDILHLINDNYSKIDQLNYIYYLFTNNLLNELDSKIILNKIKNYLLQNIS